MDPVTQYLTAIQQELAQDPAQLGYANKTADQQVKLLNEPYTVMVPQVQTPRIAQIINQIPFAPNVVTSQDITNAQKAITPQVIIQTDQEISQEDTPAPVLS